MRILVGLHQNQEVSSWFNRYSMEPFLYYSMTNHFEIRINYSKGILNKIRFPLTVVVTVVCMLLHRSHARCFHNWSRKFLPTAVQKLARFWRQNGSGRRVAGVGEDGPGSRTVWSPSDRRGGVLVLRG